MPRNKRQEWEAEYVSEYCQRTFGHVPVIYHARLGTWPTPLTAPELLPEEQMMLRVRMRWADAVVILPNALIIIEGKLRAPEFLKGLGELIVYTHLIRHTPEYEKFLDRRIEGRLVIPIEDPTVMTLARKYGLTVDVYQPSFWTQYVQQIFKRVSRPIRPEEASLFTA